MELGPLATLNEDTRHARKAVEPGLDFVGRQLPEVGLRHRVGGQAVADDGKAGKVETIGPDVRCRRETALNARDGRIDHLQRLQHVDVPVEEEVDLGRAAAADRSDVFKAGHDPNRFLDRPGDRDLHLLDRHHAVLDADDDPRKVRRRENGNGQRQRFVNADRREHAIRKMIDFEWRANQY